MSEIDEKKSLAELTPAERRWLGRHACGWCEQPLNLTGCGAISEPCDVETRLKRWRDCLATKPAN